MSEPFVGQVIAVGFNFVPVGWLPCDGSLQSIAEYTTLYNLIGTTYGGDGNSTFALPDLRGRGALGIGQGHAMSNYVLGQPGGTEQVTLSPAQIGGHTHQMLASGQTGTSTTPNATAALAANSQSAAMLYGPPSPNITALNGGAITSTGGNAPHNNRQPFQVINYIICYAGIFPQH